MMFCKFNFLLHGFSFSSTVSGRQPTALYLVQIFRPFSNTQIKGTKSSYLKSVLNQVKAPVQLSYWHTKWLLTYAHLFTVFYRLFHLCFCLSLITNNLTGPMPISVFKVELWLKNSNCKGVYVLHSRLSSKKNCT